MVCGIVSGVTGCPEEEKTETGLWSFVKEGWVGLLLAYHNFSLDIGHGL